MARVRSDFWVASHLRRCGVEGVTAVLRRRGAAEAGAIFVKVDRLDGTGSLYGPAPQLFLGEADLGRLFSPVVMDAPVIDIEDRIRREQSFDPDLWLIEIEDRAGRHFLGIATGNEGA
jgi:hypothetical protein